MKSYTEIEGCKIDDMTTAELVAHYNALTGESVKRFSDRASGLRRVAKALAAHDTEELVAVEAAKAPQNQAQYEQAYERIGATPATVEAPKAAQTTAQAQAIVNNHVAAEQASASVTAEGKRAIIALRKGLYNYVGEPGFTDVDTTDAAKAMGVSEQSAARVMDRVVELGLVEREDYTANGRTQQFYNFTDAGRAYCDTNKITDRTPMPPATLAVSKPVSAPKSTVAAPKVTLPAKPSRKECDSTTVIGLKSNLNPKKAGTAAFDRFELYIDGMTVVEALAAGITREDIRWDSKHGHITVTQK